jgi:hypothetical protein
MVVTDAVPTPDIVADIVSQFVGQPADSITNLSTGTVLFWRWPDTPAHPVFCQPPAILLRPVFSGSDPGVGSIRRHSSLHDWGLLPPEINERREFVPRYQPAFDHIALVSELFNLCTREAQFFCPGRILIGRAETRQMNGRLASPEG